MAAFLSWFDQNWFTFIQTVGIVGGLWLTTKTLRREQRARKLGDLLTLAGQHRELWSDVHRRPDLGRLLKPQVDLVASPISVAEEEFLNLVIVHFYTGWLLAKEAGVLKLDVLAQDARAFFALPIPRAIWEQTKAQRDAAFVRFVERSLSLRRRWTLGGLLGR